MTLDHERENTRMIYHTQFYCDRMLMSPPMSTRPDVISNTVHRFPSLPLYCIAVSRDDVVDIRPNSTAAQ